MAAEKDAVNSHVGPYFKMSCAASVLSALVRKMRFALTMRRQIGQSREHENPNFHFQNAKKYLSDLRGRPGGQLGSSGEGANGKGGKWGLRPTPTFPVERPGRVKVGGSGPQAHADLHV